MNINISDIESALKDKISREISLKEEGVNRFRIFNPYEFDDGDHFSIFLKKENGHWKFTDEAHTIMHLSYDMDVSALKKEGTRQKILTNIISNFGLDEYDGSLSIRIESDDFGSAFYNYIHALIKVTDLSYLSKEIVRSTFYEDFRALIRETVPEERLTFDFTHPDYDKEGKYVVDCRINGMPKPIFLFAVPNDSKCKDAMITMYCFNNWGVKYHSVAIFEDQEQINRRVLAQFSDIGEKQFSTLLSNKERIKEYLSERIA
ncbi:MAG TPA: DUF1828 domain-containing protein [Smithellaceae bacterium]|jgi:hypothetical protein|nr:MAG: hypothetical protein BWX44_01474 [Spirochaetes bacterium ADurb.Bin001]HNV56665.1 DUF1828 domain-containing protein [Smithellaceae bacterium]HPM21838.1 DUF1828 domain-containing protein [Thermotogota bacterium]HQN71192.1 DUF1828 domain-containing protein [Smithella sp.]HNY97165.1 DUF1828 domain-containing protein [Smithellaceae bacterium]